QLSDFAVSKSQRRVLKKNKDLRVENRPIKITEESENLFHRHKQRFDHAVPDSIYNFLSHQPATVPCEARELAVYLDEKLIASTYYDIGKNSISAIYSIFDPRHQNRSLGIFLLLNGINYAIESRKEFLYHGYCYDRSSFYDYKKRFIGTEDFDWKSSWISIDRNF
ncbi:MAG: arginine-tRNA-protein transferase, partial [Pyrinomonadaceae bacterium]